MKRPSPLRPGDEVSLIAPAGPVTKEDLERAVSLVADLGFNPRVGRYALGRRGFLAGEDAERFSDLALALSDPATRAVLPLRGGYGTARLLPNLDLESFSRAPKILIGFSDLTALHLALDRYGVVTFHGPMPAVGEWTDYDRQLLWRLLTDPTPVGALPWPADLAPVPLAPGSARGWVVGGNLSVVQSSLGTPWEIQTAGRLLLLEEVAESPYRLDRSLNHLQQAGKFQGIAGVLLGQLAELPDAEAEEALGVCREYFADLGVPVLANLPFGHGRYRATLPLGTMVHLQADAGLVSLEEGALEPAS